MSRKNNAPPAPTLSIQVGQATNSFIGGVVNGPVHVGPGGPFSAPPGAPSPDPAAHVPAAPPPAFPILTPAPTPAVAPGTAAPGPQRTSSVPFAGQEGGAPTSGEPTRPAGRVAPAPADSSRAAAAVRVYVSFADEDARFAGELEKHLAPHLRDGTLTLWHRGLLRPGDLREPTTFRELAAARVIVLLLSANHAAALSGEVERAVERQGRGAATLVPVRLRAAAPLPALAPFQSLPPNGPPLASRRSRDSAWTEVVKGILGVSARFEPA